MNFALLSHQLDACACEQRARNNVIKENRFKLNEMMKKNLLISHVAPVQPVGHVQANSFDCALDDDDNDDCLIFGG